MNGLSFNFDQLDLGVEVSAREIPELKQQMDEAQRKIQARVEQEKAARQSQIRKAFLEEWEMHSKNSSTQPASIGRIKKDLERRYQLAWREEEAKIDAEATRLLSLANAPVWRRMNEINRSLLDEARKKLMEQKKSLEAKLKESMKMVNERNRRMRELEDQLRQSEEKRLSAERSARDRINSLEKANTEMRVRLEVYKELASKNPSYAGIALKNDSSPPAGSYEQQQPECKFFMRGMCLRGSACQFRHNTPSVGTSLDGDGVRNLTDSFSTWR
mmetsp:Transcript_13237/g.25351  ORF Transcript_13237/g.25351 Transcript_13237/m.25351 type:complete len:273 (-) Transcript_13237:72-890(-)